MLTLPCYHPHYQLTWIQHAHVPPFFKMQRTAMHPKSPSEPIDAEEFILMQNLLLALLRNPRFENYFGLIRSYALTKTRAGDALECTPYQVRIQDGIVQVNVYSKIIRNIRTFFGPKPLKMLPSYQDALHHLPVHSPAEQKFERKSQLVQTDQAITCLSTLLKDGTYWKKLKQHGIDEFKEESCAFCKDSHARVAKNQIIWMFTHFLLFASYAPYPGTKAHFLLSPKRHVEDWRDLTPTEQSELARLITIATGALQMIHGQETQAIWQVQTGVSAGQTVPHTHMHILTPPSFEGYVYDFRSQLRVGPSKMPHPTQLTPTQLKPIIAFWQAACAQQPEASRPLRSPPSAPLVFRLYTQINPNPLFLTPAPFDTTGSAHTP